MPNGNHTLDYADRCVEAAAKEWKAKFKKQDERIKRLLSKCKRQKAEIERLRDIPRYCGCNRG